MSKNACAACVCATPEGLHVVRDLRAAGPDLAFLAQRSSPSPSPASHWSLHLTTSETAGVLTRVVPRPVAQCLDVDGTLVLVFQSSVRAVQIDVKGGRSAWRFWGDGGAAV